MLTRRIVAAGIVAAGTTDWTKAELELDSGEHETLQVNCLLGGWGTSSGRAWFDDVELEPVVRPPAEAATSPR